MSIWSGIEKVEATNSGSTRLPYLVPGEYASLRISGCKRVVSQKNAMKQFFIVEFDVLESDTDLKQASWLVDLSFGEGAFRDVKGFVSAALPDQPVTPELMDSIESPEQPLAGMLVSASAYNKPTQSGRDFTKVIFTSAVLEN